MAVATELFQEINGYAINGLRSGITQEGFNASGIEENYGAFFGRDAEIVALFLLNLYRNNHERRDLLAPVEKSLNTMVQTQGRAVNSWRDEEPGKIIHEFRHSDALKNQQWLDKLLAHGWPVEGEKDRRFMRYYGSADSTPLFVVLASEYLLLSKNESMCKILESAIEKALKWIQLWGDADRDGYDEFKAKNENALENQGWQDSGNSILAPDGKRPEGPIALVEVQGYVYWAYYKAAEWYIDKDPEKARLLREKATALKNKFNKDFWMEEEGFFALALDGKKKQVPDVKSNVGHLLITGIIDDEKIPRVVQRLMKPDMFTNWGIRTLSSDSSNYTEVEPLNYHNGTIWPHDNAIVYLGLKKYGYHSEAQMVKNAIIGAQHELKKRHGIENPELWAVDRGGNLVRYMGAQDPQSWAAGANAVLTEEYPFSLAA